MDCSPLPAFWLFLAFSAFFSTSRSSTIGVDYISSLLHIQDRERAPPSVQVSAARGVLQRLLPSRSSAFEFRIVSKEKCGGDSCFMIENHTSFAGTGASEILISGFTAVEVLAGLHWYLKYWCGSLISWDKTGGAQLDSVPQLGSMPRVEDDRIVVQRPIPWNYYQNVVTSSCSCLKNDINLIHAFWKILLLGGTGKDGKKKLTGWLSKVSTCH